MKTNLVTLVGITLLASRLLAQNEAKPRLFCEGEYSSVEKDRKGEPKIKKIDHWHIDLVPDGSYSVDVEVEGPNIEEHHLLTKEFKPRGFVSVLSGGIGSGKQPMKIECEYGATELSCRAAFNGLATVAKMEQKPPYLFVPTFEAPAFDFPWAFQPLVSQAERTIGQKTAMAGITLEDGESETA